MASGIIPLTELAKINNRNLSGNLASEIAEAAPCLMSLNSLVASQSNVHQWLVYSGAPAPAFRALNDGRDEAHSVDRNATISCAIMDASFTFDVAAGYGHINGTEALIAREGTRHLRQSFFSVGKQVFYGTGLAAAGFQGMLQANDQAGSPLVFYNDLAREMVVNAGGTTASVQSSVWLLRTGPDDISIVTGNNGEISMGESRVQRIIGANSKPLAAWHTPITALYGLQWGGKYSACRICNVEASLTDDIIAQGIAKFPVGFQPNLCVMSRRSHRLLRESRTATNPSGAPAPFVEEVFGIRVVVTDELVDTEAVVVAA